MLFMISCQSGTKYKSAEKSDKKYGYTDTKIGENFYKVTFLGNEETERSTVDDYMLYRSAQLAQKNNMKFIEFISRDMKAIKNLTNEQKDHYDYRDVYGRPSFVNYTYPYFTAGPVTRPPHSTPDQVEKEYKAIAYVKLHKKEVKNRNLIPAQEIIKNIKVKKP
ncbi:MAG: hypothetical protein CME62_06315 [Halobacteriovoraceae bacterium]|nr:hypothetical protein [Halobacteriovoraceae bacterium]|tara:strand:- start:1093 stop:1584 length:492 start_codon:yes stop_codon:yes gene_type:complete